MVGERVPEMGQEQQRVVVVEREVVSNLQEEHYLPCTSHDRGCMGEQQQRRRRV